MTWRLPGVLHRTLVAPTTQQQVVLVVGYLQVVLLEA
jgi:hypothetical protein